MQPSGREEGLTGKDVCMHGREAGLARLHQRSIKALVFGWRAHTAIKYTRAVATRTTFSRQQIVFLLLLLRTFFYYSAGFITSVATQSEINTVNSFRFHPFWIRFRIKQRVISYSFITGKRFQLITERLRNLDFPTTSSILSFIYYQFYILEFF